MIRFIIRALVAAAGLWAASRLDFVHIEGLKPLLVAGVLLGVVNALVRPVVTLLTMPISVLTLGLFLLVVNGLMVLLVGWLLHLFGVHGFHTLGLWRSILTTIVIWVVSLAANLVLGGELRGKR